jgi:DNA modification methylase
MAEEAPFFISDKVALYHGACLSVLPTLPAAFCDAVITDPPYPEIDRSYGTLSEADWHTLMHGVVHEVRRVLKPTGSAVFLLQPNSEKVGRTRPWLWDFMAWVCREWNLVQDVYWWNSTALPGAGCERRHGLLRRSIKTCVWCGPSDCYRNQDAVLWEESDWNKEQRARQRFGRKNTSSGNGAAVERGGVTPFNLLLIPATGNTYRGNHGHPAATPLAWCEWWVKYLTPPGGLVLDPFAGSCTTGEAALRHGCRFLGIEQHQDYLHTARERFLTMSIKKEQP